MRLIGRRSFLDSTLIFNHLSPSACIMNGIFFLFRTHMVSSPKSSNLRTINPEHGKRDIILWLLKLASTRIVLPEARYCDHMRPEP